MSLTDLYISFKDASEKCMKFLNLKCMKCHYCNNCPFCEIYCNLLTINEWFLLHFKNPRFLTDNSTRAVVFKELQIKNNLKYSYDHHYSCYYIHYDDLQEIGAYNSHIRDLIFICLCLIRNYQYTKIEDEHNKIIVENKNDNILIEIGANLFQQLIKARCSLEVPHIIKCIKENNQCLFLNKELIDELIKYTSFKIEIFYDIINNPDKYYNFLNKTLNLYYSKTCMSCIN